MLQPSGVIECNVLIPLMVFAHFAQRMQCREKRGPAIARQPSPCSQRWRRNPCASSNDAADDPAIWVHPTDPARSLIIGTDKKHGLDVYDLSGKRVQSLPDGRMNNVDLRYGFPLGGGEVAIVAATNRTDQTLALYAVDANGRLSNVADGKIATGLADPYGLCMYRSPAGEYFVFANEGDEVVLINNGSSKPAATASALDSFASSGWLSSRRLRGRRWHWPFICRRRRRWLVALLRRSQAAAIRARKSTRWPTATSLTTLKA